MDEGSNTLHLRQGVPGASVDGNGISTGEKMGKAIAALVIGGGLADVAQGPRTVKHALLEEQNFGVTHRVAPFVSDDAGKTELGARGNRMCSESRPGPMAMSVM